MKHTYRFAAFSDAHLHTPEDETFAKLIAALAALQGDEKPDAVVDLGDNLAMLGRESSASNEQIADYLHTISEKVQAATDLPLFSVNGNHDGIGTDFFDVPLWNRAVGSQFARGMSVHEGEGEAQSAYYYVDLPDNALRLIALSLPHGADVHADMPTPLWSFGDAQLRWLAKTALCVPAGWDVLILCHVPFCCAAYFGDFSETLEVFNGETRARSTIASLCGWIEDRDTAEGILHAFHSHTAFDDDARDIHVSYESAGALLAVIGGHEHCDAILYPGDPLGMYVNRLPCPQILIGAALTRYNGAAKDRSHGFAFDVITVTPDAIILKRRGDGEDRIVPFARENS